MPNKTKNNKKTANGRKQNKNAKNPVKQVVVYRDRPQSRPQDTTLGAIGRLAGNGISKFFGWGDYKLSSNNMWNASEQMPYMHSTNSSIRFRNREFVRDLFSTVSFNSISTTQQSFSLNPGLSETFPYLSSIASNFQEYKFHGVVFEYRTNSSDGVTGSVQSVGYVALSCNYRADATVPQDKLSMLNEQWSVDGRPSENLFLPIECNPMEKPMDVQYIRTGALAASYDQKFYDLGTLYFQGVTPTGAVNSLGELWVSYDVELFKPNLQSGGAGTYNAATPQAHYEATVGITNSAPFGTNSTAKYDGIGLTVTSTSITFPRGFNSRIYFIFEVGGASTACTVPSFTLTNLTQSSNQVGAAGSWSPGAVTTAQLVYSTTYDVTDPGASTVITWNTGTLPATAVLSAFAIVATNSDYIAL